MSSIKVFAEKELHKLSNSGYYRKIITVENLPANHVEMNGRKLLSFASNDYLGLKFNEEIIEYTNKLVIDHALGSGSSRFVCGNYALYNKLEQDIADFKNCEAASVFGSGYLTNIGVIPALVDRNDIVIADKLIHASLIDGIKLSGAKFFRYIHNDLNHLENLLNLYRKDYNKCLIITESIFGMDGDKADINMIKKIAEKYDSWVMIDDAHSTGENIPEVDILIGTFSKSFNSYGGYICGNEILVNYIKNKARSLIFTTALPAYVIASSISALEYVKNNPTIYNMPKAKAEIFCDYLKLDKPRSHIVPIIIGDPYEAIDIKEKIEEKGYLVSAIRPPSVPKNTSRIRLSFCATHKDSDITKLAEIIIKFRNLNG